MTRARRVGGLERFGECVLTTAKRVDGLQGKANLYLTSVQKYQYETKRSKESRYGKNKQSTQQCKVHEIRVTDEIVDQVAVPLLISHQWRPRSNLRHDYRMSENPCYT